MEDKMSEEVTPKTFDLAAALSGINYPSVDVEVYFDEALAYEISEINRKLDILSSAGKDEEYLKLEKKFDGFLKSVQEHKFTFTIKGVPAYIENSITDEIKKKFPVKRNALGVAEQDNTEADEEYVKLIFGAYISKIVAPDGSVIAPPSSEDILALRSNAPAHVLNSIQQAIVDLKTKTANGFEIGIKSADFLSKP
jgi:hypothetical protein